MFTIIKLLACIFMVIDHIGLIFFPEIVELRIIGRLSMPFFAYAIARGFYYSKMHGTLARYKKSMIIFSVISQIPYMFMMQEFSLNIGVLWLCSILFLERAEMLNKEWKDNILMLSVLIITFVGPISYGIYGLAFTLIMYYYEVKTDNGTRLYISYAALHILQLIRNLDYGLIQIFTLPSLPLIDILKKHDNKIRISGRFFYTFYPLHIIVLLIIKELTT